jgi:hypothetical protein
MIIFYFFDFLLLIEKLIVSLRHKSSCTGENASFSDLITRWFCFLLCLPYLHYIEYACHHF